VKNESDEEREQRKARKAASRKVKSEAPSGDEGGLSTPGAGGGGGGGGGEPKKKRRKLKKGSGAPSAEASAQVSDAEDGGALFSGAEDEKPTKKVPVSFISFFFFFQFGLTGRTYGGRSASISAGRRGNALRAKMRKSPRRPHRAKSNSECLSLVRRGSQFSLLSAPFF
jgi:hypothetical protein